jgi:hypothetical protein
MTISGMIREFSIKSPIFEMSSKLEEEIKEVQTDVTKSTKDINDKIQSINTLINSKLSKFEYTSKVKRPDRISAEYALTVLL